MNYKYDDAIEMLTSQGKFYIDLGLDRISKVMEILGNPQDNLRYIHVAGTNGKGSVCAIIASILKCAGLKVGLYSSPHIYKYNERIKILQNTNTKSKNSKSIMPSDDDNISDEDFAKYVFNVCEISEQSNIRMTEFEILTAVMFKYFFDKNVDIVVLETGLGGRFDATNIIKENLCSVITHIDLDHTDRLGDTKDKIAYEKAGIIKPGCPVVTCEKYKAIEEKANNCNSRLIKVTPRADTSLLALKGLYQQENLALALAATKVAFPEITNEIINNGLSNVTHPCRFQFIKDKMLLIDGAHNPNGIKALKDSLDKYFPKLKRRFVFGCLKTKDYKTMINTLFSENDEIYFNNFSNPNSVTFEELQAVCKFPAKKFVSLDNLLFDNNTLTIVCGSLYMIKEVIN